MMERFQQMRLLEAVLFASTSPMRRQDLAKFLPEDADVGGLLEELTGHYANRGVNLVRVGERWAFRSAPDLAELMRLEKAVRKKLSRAAIETLAIVAYHQPVTRAEIEEIRGVGLSKGTLDTLLELGWIKPRGRRRTPGRPVTWGTSDGFLDHFGLESLDALPGQEELKAAGLLDSRPAISSLAARGMLPPAGEASEQGEEDEEAEARPAEPGADLLDADFGEDLLPDDDERDSDDAGSDEAEALEEQETPADAGHAKRAAPSRDEVPPREAGVSEDLDDTQGAAEARARRDVEGKAKTDCELRGQNVALSRVAAPPDDGSA